MDRTPPCSLSPAEWAVLGVVAEGETHGFAVARLFAPGGALGIVWTLPRPVIYQTIKKLIQLDLVTETATQPSPRGPARTILVATPSGHGAVQRWLGIPVEHIRDIRSAMLLKLVLLDRAGTDTRPLIQAQRAQLSPLVEGLEQSRDEAQGFDRVVAEWRLASSKAAVAFLDAL